MFEGASALGQGELRAYLRRTEGRLTLLAAVMTLSALVLGAVGMVNIQHRQDLLDDAVDRRGALTSAALDIYRTFADADATSLNAVLVDERRAPALQQDFREDVFDAVDALREAVARDPEGSSTEHVRRLTDLVPQYVQLVETGWAASRNDQPVGTNYLAQGSHLVRNTILKDADELHDQQIAALTRAQREASGHDWATYALGAVVLSLLFFAQRFLFRRTRRKFNIGLLAATALTLVPLLWLPIALAISSSHAEDSVVEREQVVAPLAEARNLGRFADGVEARMMIYPAVGDETALSQALQRILTLVGEAERHSRPGPEQERIDRAQEALKAWSEADSRLVESQDPPLNYPTRVALVLETGNTTPNAQQVDEHLTAAIDGYTRSSARSTLDARGPLDGLDVGFALLMVGAALSAVAGLWPRIMEYYR